MRTLLTLAALVGLVLVSFAPAAKAHCPHGNNPNQDHCPGEPPDLEDLENRVTDLESALSFLEAFVLVGFSTTEVNPTTDAPGFPGMHAVCQEIFGPVSRLCTGKEYALTLDVVGAPTSAGAWVHNPFQGLGEVQDRRLSTVRAGLRLAPVAEQLSLNLVASRKGPVTHRDQ